VKYMKRQIMLLILLCLSIIFMIVSLVTLLLSDGNFKNEIVSLLCLLVGAIIGRVSAEYLFEE